MGTHQLTKTGKGILIRQENDRYWLFCTTKHNRMEKSWPTTFSLYVIEVFTASVLGHSMSITYRCLVQQWITSLGNFKRSSNLQHKYTSLFVFQTLILIYYLRYTSLCHGTSLHSTISTRNKLQVWIYGVYQRTRFLSMLLATFKFSLLCFFCFRYY